ncbi:hypothetical protein CR513_53262, partial [Mucuna pruriens]
MCDHNCDRVDSICLQFLTMQQEPGDSSSSSSGLRLHPPLIGFSPDRRTGKSQMFQNVVLRNLLAPAEDVDLGHIGEAELVDLNLRAEGDKPDEGVVGEKANGLSERGFEEVKLLVDDAGVEEEEKDGGLGEGRVRVGDGILNSGILGVKFAGEVGLGDLGVVRGEVVAIVAEGADPDLGGEVNAREGIEDRRAGSAAERGVRECGRDVRVVTDEGDGGGQGNHALARLHFRARPQVPRHAHAVHAFRIGVRHLRHSVTVDFI